MEFINMDKRFKLSKILIWLLFSGMLVWRPTRAFGFDSANSCTPNGGGGGAGGKMSRRGRAQLLATIPCDLTRQPYCNLPGSAYPWQAVRRFLHDNQGLVRRMYGDMRHISVLRDELESNEIDGADMEMAADRYTRDGHRRSAKFLQQREEYGAAAATASAPTVAGIGAATGGIAGLVGLKRDNEVLMEPHFRPVSTTPAAAAAVEATQSSAPAIATTTTTTADATTTTTTPPPAVHTTTTAPTTSAPVGNRPTRGRGSSTASSTTPPTTTTPKSINSSNLTPPTPRPADGGTEATTTTTTAAAAPARVASNGKGGNAGHHRRRGPTKINHKPETSPTNSTGAALKEPPYEHLIETNSVLYEAAPSGVLTPTATPAVGNDAEMTGENIRIVDSPQLGVAAAAAAAEALGNVSQPVSTISTTLKLASSSSRVESLLMLAPKKPPAQSMRQRPQQHHHYQQQQQQQQQQLANTKDNSRLSESERVAATTPITTPSIRVAANVVNATATATTTTSAAASTVGIDIISNNNNNNKRFNSNHQALREQTAELLLTGEKLRRQPLPSPPQPPAAPLGPTSAGGGGGAKPAAGAAAVLHDGQLFQDTLQKETPQVVNLRGVNACPVKEEVVAPFWANNTRGEVLALLNLYPFEQYVHFEKCTHEHKQMYCRDGCRCEQQFRLHRLLAYDPHNECRGIFSDWFRFPSCCICKCYNVPMEFRATSRSPRSQRDDAADFADIDDNNDDAALWQLQQQQQQQQQQRRQQPSPLELAEAEVKRAIYEHATEDWYRPKDDLDFYEG